MNRAYLPPLLRGIGTTIVLVTTLISICVARQDVRANQLKREMLHAKAKAGTPTGTGKNDADLSAEDDDLRVGTVEESVAEEVIGNPWFDWIVGLGSAVIASSFFVESYVRSREKS
jgi:hypothetical protein